MGKKNKKSSTSGDDLANTKKHKRSPTTDVDTAHVPSSKSFKNVGKSVLEPCSASKGKLKKQISEENDEDEKISLKNEIKELSKSVKELTEAVEKQKEILQTIADQHEGKDEGAADYCNYECEEAKQDRYLSIIVKGLDEGMGRRKDIKKVLGGVFGSCGKIKSIFVPIACQTGVSLGYAFITFEDHKGGNEKALKMNGEFLKGRQLEVKMARGSDELHGYSGSAASAVGCIRCLYQKRGVRIPELVFRHRSICS